MTNYCFLDLETTGFDSQKDSIIEIAFLIYDENKRQTFSFEKVIIPRLSLLSPQITRITGITQEEIDTKGISFEFIKEDVQKRLQDTVLVGHNIDFDIGFLISNGIDLANNSRIDTHELARILLPNEESYALEILSQKYGISHDNAHRAMSDVEANRDFFYLLLDHIKEMPIAFFEKARPLLSTKSQWYAKELFFGQDGTSPLIFPKEPLPDFKEHQDTAWIEPYLDTLSPEKAIFVKQGDCPKSENSMVSIAHKLVEKGEEVLIISQKLSFFPSVRKFPTPQVLFDPDRLDQFARSKDKFSDIETIFYLQCLYRHVLGFRGMWAFDLFSEERDLWEYVSMTSFESPVFQPVLEERKKDKILAISPNAFFQFSNLDFFQNRVLIVDESELFAEKLLFYSTKTYSLFSFLDHEDEKLSVAIQFWISNFCKEVLESKLQHAMTPFPQSVNFESYDTFALFAQSLREISSHPRLLELADMLEHAQPLSVRWATFYPERGDLVFGIWHPEHWKNSKDAIKNFRKIFFYRHQKSESNAYFRMFIGQSDGTSLQDAPLFSPRKLIIPTPLESVKSPTFNDFCADKIKTIAQENVTDDAFVLATFSSQETLKKVFETVSQSLIGSDITLLGEKVMGGDGKVLQKIKEAHRLLFFDQRILDPELCNIPFKTMIIQKFPFPPPHPLFEKLDEMLKQSGINFWDAWTIPMVTSHLARRISLYPFVEKIYWLDPRENAGWGKEILHGAILGRK